jgi:hypothetical protein
MKKKGMYLIFVGLLLYSSNSYGKPVHYSFTSVWEVRAPVEKVWELLNKGEEWHQWWKSLVGTEVLQQPLNSDTGQVIRYTWRALLPVTLTIDFRITKKEIYKRIEGVSTGDLVGIGIWTFEEHDGITRIRYNWEVESTKKIVNLVSPFLKGFFIYNHNLIMRRGAKGLAKKLGVKLIEGRSVN